MQKRRTNPNKIPISIDSKSLQDLSFEITTRMVMKSWILVLGALADFNDTTTESLFQLWDFINSHTPKRHTFDEVSRELKQIEEIADVSLPYKKMTLGPIKTKGDLDRFTRQMEQGALLTHIAFIAKPIIDEKLLRDNYKAPFFRKVCSLNEEISQGRISMQDIEKMLEEEFSLRLFFENGEILLGRHRPDG